MSRLLAVAFLILCGHSYAQEIPDSLQANYSKALQSGNNYEIGNSLTKIGEYFLNAQHYDSARKYYIRALSWNNQYKYMDLLARNLNDLGVLNYFTGSLDSSISYYRQAIEAHESLRDTSSAIQARLNLAIDFRRVGLYKESLQQCLEAAYDLQQGTDSTTLASCYNTIGNIYSKLGDFDESLSFHHKALELRKRIHNSKSVSQSYNNIANLYEDIGNQDSAVYYYSMSLQIKRSIGDRQGEAVTLTNIGNLLLKEKKPGEAEAYFLQSLNIKRELGNKASLVPTLNGLAQLELGRKNYEHAWKYLSEAEELGTDMKLLADLKTNYEYQVNLFTALRDYATAFEYSKRLSTVKDSLLSAELLDKTRALRTQFEVDKIQLSLEQEKSLHHAEVENNKLWITVLVVATVLGIVIAGLIYNQYRVSQRNRNRVETLLKELHHRVKNNLQILSSILTLQSQDLKDTYAIEAVKSNEGRINAMALIHKKLYNTDQSREINAKEYIDELLQYLPRSYGYAEDEIKLSTDVENIQLDVDKAIPLGLIVNELISNALKHAFKAHTNPTLTVNLKKTDMNNITVEIRDNGKGLPDNSEYSTQSFGLKMVNTLVKDLKGTIETQNHNGTAYILQIPLNR